MRTCQGGTVDQTEGLQRKAEGSWVLTPALPGSDVYEPPSALYRAAGWPLGQRSRPPHPLRQTPASLQFGGGVGGNRLP